MTVNIFFFFGKEIQGNLLNISDKITLVLSRTATDKNIKHIKCKIVKDTKPLITSDFNTVSEFAKSKGIES